MSFISLLFGSYLVTATS